MKLIALTALIGLTGCCGCLELSPALPVSLIETTEKPTPIIPPEPPVEPPTEPPVSEPEKNNKGFGNGNEGDCQGSGCDDSDNPGEKSS